MKYAPVLALLFAAGILEACAGIEVPPEHLYVLHLPCQDREGDLDPAGPWFFLDDVRGLDFARGNTIWARVSPIEMEAWRHHKWALPITEVVEAAILEWARSCGRFAGAGPAGDKSCFWNLLVTVENFEEVDEGDQWFAHVSLRLVFEYRPKGGGERQRVWQGRLTARVPARTRHPEALVLAFGRALEEVLERGIALATVNVEEEE